MPQPKPMADFGFYKDVFLGDRIPEKAFASLAQRAREVLQSYERAYRVTSPGEDSYRMAICTMAETLYAYSKRRSGVTGASVGEVSVRYEGGDDAQRSLQRELYRKASIYLDITRGVKE